MIKILMRLPDRACVTCSALVLSPQHFRLLASSLTPMQRRRAERLSCKIGVPLWAAPHEEVLHNSLAQGHIVRLEGKLAPLFPLQRPLA